MRIGDIMNPTLETIDPDQSIMEAACKMRDLNVSSLTVVDGDRFLGVITDRDICCRAACDGRAPATTPVRQIMSKDTAYCFSDQEIAEAAQMMEDKRLRRLAVLDRDRKAIGTVWLDDLARHAPRSAH